MKEINKQLDILINYTENQYKIMCSIEVNMIICVIFLLNILMKIKMSLFYKCEHKNEIKFF